MGQIRPKYKAPSYSIDYFKQQPEAVKIAIDAAIAYYVNVEDHRDELVDKLKNLDIEQNGKAKLKIIIDIVQAVCSLAGSVLIGFGENIITSCLFTPCKVDYVGYFMFYLGIFFLAFAILSPFLPLLIERFGVKK